MAENDKATAKSADKSGAATNATKTPPSAKKAGGKATAAVADDGPKCRADKCKQPVRAKGYCRKHYIGWRRGEVGKKHQYKICSKEGCRKPRFLGGHCEEHSGKAKPAEGAAA
jgi:hypothetical protein